MVTKKEKNYYEKILKILGSLTNLFSDSKIPYLNYRITENLYCKAFSAKNLARSDVSADAALGDKGVGIKTFINRNGKTFQKIAEFNKDNIQFRGLKSKELALKVSELRNERIETTKRIYGLNSMIYHCIVRKKGKIQVYECDMDLVDTKKLTLLKDSNNTILFKDKKNEYTFNISKSTLYKRFVTGNVLYDIDVQILKDPFDVLEKKFQSVKNVYYKKSITENPYVILPLYSKTKDSKTVHAKSGLNQWNEGGRKRDVNEIYIPIPIWIHSRFSGFFLPRETNFKLILPDETELDAKVCQDNSKALMSKHNADLGKWLLRQVLNLNEGELLTYEKLQKIGLDSVIIEKIDEGTYAIDFRPSGTYEDFIEQNK